jgi:hypothetical protein
VVFIGKTGTTEVKQELSFTNLSVFPDEASFLSQYDNAMQNRTGLNGVQGASVKATIEKFEVSGQVDFQSDVSREVAKKIIAKASAVPETSVTMDASRRLSRLRHAEERQLAASYSYVVILSNESNVDLVVKVKQVQTAVSSPAQLEAAAKEVTNSSVSLNVKQAPMVKVTTKVVIVAPPGTGSGLDLVKDVAGVATDLGGNSGTVISVTTASTTATTTTAITTMATATTASTSVSGTAATTTVSASITNSSIASNTTSTQTMTCAGFKCPSGCVGDSSTSSNATVSTANCCKKDNPAVDGTPSNTCAIVLFVIMLSLGRIS